MTKQEDVSRSAELSELWTRLPCLSKLLTICPYPGAGPPVGGFHWWRCQGLRWRSCSVVAALP